MKRESFRSRLGLLLVSAVCAIGIGNVWRFPYIAGKNGGGYFVLFYLLCLLVMGVPVLTMELAVGRASRRSAVLSYKTLEKPGQKWHIHGWFCLLGCYLLMMYYTTVSGWMVSYFGKFLTGAFHSGMSTDEVARAFGAMLFLQSTILVAGLMVFKDHALMGVGLMLSAGEVPRIAGSFGLDTTTRANITSAVYTAQAAVNTTRTIAAAIK